MTQDLFRTQQKSRRAGRVVWIALIGLLVFLAWASVARIDQFARSKAVVIAAARTQEIQSSDGGVLTELLVKEGDKVTAGQRIAVLEKERAQAAYDDSAAKVAALRISEARLSAEVYGGALSFQPDLMRYPQLVQAQRDLYTKRRQSLNQEVAALQKVGALAARELAMNEPLLAQGDVAQADVIRLRRQVADIEMQITNRRNKYFEEAQTQLSKVQEDLNTQREMMRDRAQVLDHTEILAPTNGIVNNIKVTTIGGVLRPGDTIMQILPTSSELIVEAKVSPADIAFVKIGQPANVKLDAYDFSVFGGLLGKVTYISPDALVEQSKDGELRYYRVHIRIEGREFNSKDGEELNVMPGMTAMSEIKLKDRTVLSYLTKPITKTLQQGTGDR